MPQFIAASIQIATESMDTGFTISEQRAFCTANDDDSYITHSTELTDELISKIAAVIKEAADNE